MIERAAGERLHELIARELWQPMGAEFDAEITVDAPRQPDGRRRHQRDAARPGQVRPAVPAPRPGRAAGRRARLLGRRHDPRRARRAGARSPAARPARLPGRGALPELLVGARSGVPFFHGSGINGQNVFVHGPSQTVVAKLSTWPAALSPAAGQTVDAVTAIGRRPAGRASYEPDAVPAARVAPRPDQASQTAAGSVTWGARGTASKCCMCLCWGSRPSSTTRTGVRTRSSRAVALVAFLVAHAGSPQPRQRIAGLFWPDSTDAQALTNLRRELHHLRRCSATSPPSS